MNLPEAIDLKLFDFISPRIFFVRQHNQYLYGDKWLNELSEEKFFNETLEILEAVNNHLPVGKRNKEFLEKLRVTLSHEIDWFIENEIHSLGFIDNIEHEISLTNECKKDAPAEEKYLIEDILGENESIIESIREENNYYYDLYYFAERYNNYEDPNDAEKVKLGYIMGLHHRYIEIMDNYIRKLLENIENIEFRVFDFEQYLEDFGFKVLKHQTEVVQKCHINLNKTEVACLFKFLLEKTFFFENDERKNQIALNKFIERNFTYQDSDNSRNSIAWINKEITKIRTEKPVIYKDFLERMRIEIEQARSEIILTR